MKSKGLFAKREYGESIAYIMSGVIAVCPGTFRVNSDKASIRKHLE